TRLALGVLERELARAPRLPERLAKGQAGRLPLGGATKPTGAETRPRAITRDASCHRGRVHPARALPTRVGGRTIPRCPGLIKRGQLRRGLCLTTLVGFDADDSVGTGSRQ